MPQEKPVLSIIVVSFNTKDITKKCIETIEASFSSSPIPHEIIIVDNNSTDGSIENLRSLSKQFGTLRIIENKENTGFGKANNQGVAQAKGKYILLLNSDIEVLDEAIPKMLNYYVNNESKIDFIGGKLLNKDKSPQPSCGPFYNPLVVFGALFLKGDYWGLTRYSPNNLKKVGWVSGACILTKKEYFDKLNGFDEGIFMYMEEIDLLYRAKKMGYRTYFYPESQFIHVGFASSGTKTYPMIQVFRGFLYFYKKHYPGLFLVILRIMLQLKAGLAIGTGIATRNKYLQETYEKAFQIASMD